MNIIEKEGTKMITLHPGEYYASREKVLITTILGSCVSACLYDPVSRIVGMNHFLLSNKRYSKDINICFTEAGRYGINAMELIINEMLMLGARRETLRAKVFGGSSLLGINVDSDNFLCVGEVNCRFILEFLNNEGIPLVASNLGGDMGRVIKFSSVDFSVNMRRIGRSKTPDLANTEKLFWLRSLNEQNKKSVKPVLWP
jgi:chemotaxis protein CheD